MPRATAGILSTGTEILQGHYADTNAQWLSAELMAMGIESIRHVVAPDDARAVADALAYLAEQCDLVVMTGGLGPTEDDLTRQAVCDVFGQDLRQDEAAWGRIVERFARRGTPPPECNRVQCQIPADARTLQNEWGTAPGFVLDLTDRRKGRGGKQALPRVWFAALPGPPREMKPMFRAYLAKDLERRFGGGIMTRVCALHTFGVSESDLNEWLRPIFDDLDGDENRSIAFLASNARVDVRLIARGKSRAELRQRIDPLASRVRRRVPRGCIYGRDDQTLESVVARLLSARGLRLAVAESCTGGLVAKRLTDIPGSSDFFLEGWVTYTNEAKRARLGVRQATLRRHGAVSPQTAREMARGALKRSGADIAVALTGIAGPGGGSPEKPVGLVWYGLAWRAESVGESGNAAEGVHAQGDLRVVASSTCLPSSRDMVRAYASHRALDLVRRLVAGLPLKVR